MMADRTLTIPFGSERSLRAVLTLPAAWRGQALLILGHGANNDMDHPVVAGVHQRLARAGLAALRFNFPYAEAGRGRPDPDEVLEAALRQVRDYAANLAELQGLKVFLGGKSMGGRIAAQLAARTGEAAGLVFLGYPLHPPGKPDDLRDKPLYQLYCPVLFVQGSRDPFCHLARLGEVLAGMRVRADLHLLPGLGHSYERGKELATAEVLDEVSRTIVAWAGSL